jgi:integrase
MSARAKDVARVQEPAAPNRIRLTAQAVARSPALDKPYRVHDTKVPGLFLRVQPSGIKSFNLQWSRLSSRSLGKWPALTLEAARARALNLLVEVEKEGAPLAVLKRRSGKPSTWGEYLRDHYGPHVEATAKAGKETKALLVKQFSYLDAEPLTAITPAVFDKFKAERLKADVHPATVNRDLDRLKAALGQAVEWKFIDANPLAGKERIKRGIEERVRYLTPDEAKAFLKALDDREIEARARRVSGDAWREARHREPLGRITGYSDHLMPMALLALNTGLRRGELTQLTWNDIDFDNKLLTVRAGYAKSGKTRHVPLSPGALRVLTKWRKQHPEGRLFNVGSVTKAWRALMEKAGIEDFRFHDLRHTFASWLVMAGVDLNTVRELLGHSDIKMTLRYAHLAPEHKAAAVARLGPPRKRIARKGK